MLAICLTVRAQSRLVSVAPYYGGHKAALSLTFDDGLEEHYTLLYPQLKARALKATFAIIGSKAGGIMHSKQDRTDGTDGTPCMTWHMLRKMAADGQEIASHGWEHKAVTRLDPQALHNEIWRNDSAIMANIGKRPMTYVYPGNAKTADAVMLCEQGRAGSRTFQMSLGSKRTMPFLQRYIDDLIRNGQWGVTMTHGISQGYDHFHDPQVLWLFLDYICSKHHQLWIAPHCDVAAYVKERDNCRLTVDTTAAGLAVNVSMPLDAQIYHHELTLAVHAPVAAATQDGRQLSLVSENGTTLVNINPHGGTVQLLRPMMSAGQTIELPAMGWSSWNTYRVNISDSLIMRQANAMVSKGLREAGYTYINIDDGYFGGRDEQSGRLKIHPTRFPQGLNPVVQHIHGLGLKAGIYSDAGANTCGNWYDNDSIAEGVGLYGHDQQDCDMFFRELGFDEVAQPNLCNKAGLPAIPFEIKL